MRGKHVTKPIEEVVREAQELAADGVRELILVAQDTTYYGLDLYGRVRLAELLRELDKVDGIEWIRILYAYPDHFTDELIETLAAAKKIIPYLDMPLQHINDRVLKRMQRRVNRASTEELIARWRVAVPGPGDADHVHRRLPRRDRRGVRGAVRLRPRPAFERAGVFPYSFEPDTPAAKLDGHLPEEVKQARRDRLMAVQQEVAFDWSQRQVGTRDRSDRRRPRPGGAEPRPGPRPRRRAGHRRPGARQGQEPAAGRHRAREGDRRRRLRPGGSGDWRTTIIHRFRR